LKGWPIAVKSLLCLACGFAATCNGKRQQLLNKYSTANSPKYYKYNMTVTYTLDTIQTAAIQIIEAANNQKIWLLHGNMGAGKTTLVQALCKALQVHDDAVSSPTFSIINQYNSATVGTIYHMDWYRLKDEEEAINAGVEEALYSGCFCWIEWPSIVPNLLPNTVCNIAIEIVNEHTRKATITIGKPNS
jgi:tRNA threonylcarbamoyladenosine biosynthesis protein TsaE